MALRKYMPIRDPKAAKKDSGQSTEYRASQGGVDREPTLPRSGDSRSSPTYTPVGVYPPQDVPRTSTQHDLRHLPINLQLPGRLKHFGHKLRASSAKCQSPGGPMPARGSTVKVYCYRCKKIKKQVVISARKAFELDDGSIAGQLGGMLIDATKTGKLLGAEWVQCQTCLKVNDM
ncbi:hypothetical protein AB0J38_39260 [Streptomyces sp. NPDC050095]|uniref:hypothetical protein n=1 Tax=unclassified Streptomyces TaxID=2593676 RepID=UPI0034255C8A